MKQILTLLSLASLLFISKLQAQDLSWQELSTPKNFPVLCLKSFNNQLYAGYGGLGLLRSKDAGVSWDTLNKGLKDLFVSDILASSGKDLYVATLFKGVFSSSNGGESWTEFNSGINADLTFCLLQKGNQLYAGTSLGVFTTSIKDGTWTRLRFPKTLAPNQIVTCLYQSGNTLYAGSSKGVYVSEDDGKTWREVSNLTTYHVTAITEHKGKLLIATSGDGIIEADSKLNAFSKSSEYLGRDTAGIVSSILLTSEGLLLKGTNSKGIFQTDSTLNRGLIDYEVKAMVEHNNQLFAGTYKQGVVVFKDKKKLVSWTELNSTETGSKLVMELSPNPSTNLVKINFTLGGKEAQVLNCALLSSEGRLIKNVARKETYLPGQYNFDLNVERLAAGIYYCSLGNQKGTLKITKQLIVNH